ncbi:MAG: tripartite tricarboxylate transporter substrate-binding protein [Alphaproteobacteria bacterium]|nr:tripartite tricarboxylate transporter substrate-binding protein [Alphaproteobacteria bacterium]
MISNFRIPALGLALAMGGLPMEAHGAMSAEQFYKGKNITVLCPYSAKGGYGFLTRMIADYLPKYLPGQPRGVPQFKPGAAGAVQAGYLSTVAPRDGTAIGLMYDGLPTAQALGIQKAKFDVRQFIVLGSLDKGLTGALAVWKTSGVKTIQDAMKKQLALGSNNTRSGQHFLPLVLNRTAGTKFKLISGYHGSNGVFLAMERGELDGVFTNYATYLQHHPQWVKENRLNFLVQLGQRPHPALKGVPMMYDLAKSEIDKEAIKFLVYSRITGKAVITPPGVPAERVSALRAAFAAMVKDKGFIQRMTKTKRKVEPRTWQEARDLILATVDAKPEVLARVRELTKTTKK